jgi:transcriptional regulator with XRE-family HTH domain
MYKEAEWKTVKDLHAEGLSKAAIARALGMSRTTVRRLLELKKPPAFGRRTAHSDEEDILIRYEAYLPAIRAFLAVAREQLDSCMDTCGDARFADSNHTCAATRLDPETNQVARRSWPPDDCVSAGYGPPAKRPRPSS